MDSPPSSSEGYEEIEADQIEDLPGDSSFVSPIDDAKFDSFTDLEAYILKEYDFSLQSAIKKAFEKTGEDRFYLRCRLINYLRSTIKPVVKTRTAAEIAAAIKPEASFWQDDIFLNPVLEDDFCLRFTEDFSSSSERQES